MAETIDFTVQINADTSTIDAMKKKLEDLKASIGSVNTGSQAFSDLSKAIKDTKTELDATTQKAGETSKAVEGLASNFSVFGVNVGGVITKLQQTKDNLSATAAGLKLTSTGVGEASGALNVFKIALASTGIGLLVIALGSLITFLTQTQKGMDIVNDAMARVSGALKPLIGLASSLGEGLFNAFSHPVESLKALGNFIEQNIVNRFKAIPALLSAVGDGFQALANRDFTALKKAAVDAGQALVEFSTGLDPAQQDKIANGIKNVTSAMADQATKAAALTERERVLGLAKAAADVKEAADLDKISKLRFEASEVRLTDLEKFKALTKEAAALENESINKKIELDKEATSIAQTRYNNDKEFGLQTTQDLIKIGELQKKEKLDDAERENVLRALQKSLNLAGREEAAKTKEAKKKLLEEELADLKEKEEGELARENLTAAQVLEIKNKYNEQRKALEKADAKAVHDINAQEFIDLKEFNTKKTEELRLQHEREATVEGFGDQAAASEAAGQAEISKAQLHGIQTRLKNEDLGTLERVNLIKQEGEALAQQARDNEKKLVADAQKAFDARLAQVDKEAEAAKSVVGTTESQKAQIEAEADKAKAAAQKERDDKVLAAARNLSDGVVEIAAKTAQDTASAINKALGDFVQYAQQIQSVVSSVNKSEDQADQQRLQKDQKVTDSKKKQLDKQKADLDEQLKKKLISQAQHDKAVAVLDGQAAALDAKQEKEAQKVKQDAWERQHEADLVQAGANLALAIGRALAGGPPPFNLVLAAISAAAAGAQLAIIAGQQPPEFSTGGLVSGPGSGTSDSVPAYLSNGESVINARSTAMFAPLLSHINEAGGGKQFDFAPIRRAGGGVVEPDGHAVISGPMAESIAKAMADAIGALPPQKVYVTETDITLAQSKVAVIQNRARF